MIQEWLDDHDDIDKVCVSMLYREALKGIGKPSKFISNNIAQIMDNKIIGWKRGNRLRFQEYGSQIAWLREEEDFHDTEDAEVPF